MSEAIFIEELKFESVKLTDVLPELRIIAKYNNLELNRLSQCKKAINLLIKAVYLN